MTGTCDLVKKQNGAIRRVMHVIRVWRIKTFSSSSNSAYESVTIWSNENLVVVVGSRSGRINHLKTVLANENVSKWKLSTCQAICENVHYEVEMSERNCKKK